jgi:hypothetical protein
MGCLDLRGSGLDLTAVATAPTKKAMHSLSRERGYTLADTYKAATRFETFWLAGQWIEFGKTFRAMGKVRDTSVVLTFAPATPNVKGENR